MGSKFFQLILACLILSSDWLYTTNRFSFIWNIYRLYFVSFSWRPLYCVSRVQLQTGCDPTFGVDTASDLPENTLTLFCNGASGTSGDQFQEYVETLFTLWRSKLRKRGPKPCAVQTLNLVNPVDQEIDHKSSPVWPVGHNRYVEHNSIKVMCSACFNFYLFSSSCLSKFIFVNTNVKLVLWFVHCTFASLLPLFSLSVSFFQFTSVKPVEVLS